MSQSIAPMRVPAAVKFRPSDLLKRDGSPLKLGDFWRVAPILYVIWIGLVVAFAQEKFDDRHWEKIAEASRAIFGMAHAQDGFAATFIAVGAIHLAIKLARLVLRYFTMLLMVALILLFALGITLSSGPFTIVAGSSVLMAVLAIVGALTAVK